MTKLAAWAVATALAGSLAACGGAAGGSSNSPATHKINGLDFSACTVVAGDQVSTTVTNPNSSPVTFLYAVVNAGGQNSQTLLYTQGGYEPPSVTLQPGQSMTLETVLGDGAVVNSCSVTGWGS